MGEPGHRPHVRLLTGWIRWSGYVHISTPGWSWMDPRNIYWAHSSTWQPPAPFIPAATCQWHMALGGGNCDQYVERAECQCAGCELSWYHRPQTGRNGNHPPFGRITATAKAGGSTALDWPGDQREHGSAHHPECLDSAGWINITCGCRGHSAF